jgi:hypothetical protein
MMRIAASILPLLLVAACGRTPSARDAPGTYVLHLPAAADTLWVQPGGRYLHHYAADGTAPVVSRGTWAFEPGADRPRMMFHGFPFRTPAGHAVDPARRGTWPAQIERTGTGTVALSLDHDAELRYHRISTRMLGSGGRP